MNWMDDTIAKLQLQNKKMRIALRPFAEAAKCAETDEPDQYGLDGSSARYELTLGDLRRAARILEQ